MHTIFYNIKRFFAAVLRIYNRWSSGQPTYVYSYDSDRNKNSNWQIPNKITFYGCNCKKMWI